MSAEIPEVVFRFFASDPAGPMLTFDREVSDPRDALREPLEAFLDAFGDEIAAVQSEDGFRFFSGHRSDLDRAARVWLAENGARLLRNEFAFLVLSTTGSPNSTHWLLAAIYEQGLADQTRIRLDPFLCGPAATFSAMFYRMWVYGRPLDWARVHALEEAEHGRWMPESRRARGQFTDFAWMPRDEEVHFVCEEVPEPEFVATEAARYMHAVYSRRTRTIAHFDGALRLYNVPDIHQRSALHARNAGKMGVREKVFLVEDAQDPNVLGQVAQAFFVWNDDVQKYFSDAFTVQTTA